MATESILGLPQSFGRWFQQAAAGLGDRRKIHSRTRRNAAAPAAPAPAAILLLPEEILTLVIHQLALHDKLLLSRTCTTMRRLASCEWRVELDRYSISEKLGFWTGLAYVLPDYFICAGCYCPHRIDTSDVPSRSLLSCCPDRTLTKKTAYALEHHHVQLALKYHRLGNSHQGYLKALMASYTSARYPLTLIYTAQPRIVLNRFLLKEQWVMGNERGPVSKQSVGRDSIVLCPHVIFCLPEPGERSLDGPGSLFSQRQAIMFSTVISSAFQYRGSEQYYYCNRCPTDYSVIVTSPSSVTFTAWHDFGSHENGSPLDLYWTTQNWSKGRSKLPTLRHKQGSVRKLYLTNEGETSAITKV